MSTYLHSTVKPEARLKPLSLGRLLLATALLGTLGLNLRCGGGGGGSTPVTPPVTTGSITGTVRDFVSGLPLPGASVSDGTTTTYTASDGTYSLTSTASGRIQISVKAANYGETHRITALTAGGESKVNARLLQAAVTELADLSTDTTVTVPNTSAQVLLPANSLVTSGGAAPNYPVKASLTPIDPSFNPNLMPGDYTTSTGEQLQSYGALDATFTDSTGSPLNLAPGTTATIRIPLASFWWSGAPPTSVPAFYFNTATGRWVEEGVLALGGTGLDQYYEGTVGHFTTWNADNVAQTTCITGTVIQQQTTSSGTVTQTIAGAVVTATGSSYLGVSSIVSDANGNFTLPVMANQTFTVSATLGYLTTGSPILIVTNPSLVMNGTFPTANFWVLGTNWVFTVGQMTASAGAGTLTQAPVGLVAGTNYTLTYTVSGISGTSPSIRPSLGGTNGVARSTNGTFSETINAGSATGGYLVFTPNSTFGGTITNVSLVPLTSSGCQSVGNLRIDGQLLLTGTIRDFSPSAPYLFPYTLTTNGGFTSDTGWNKGTGWTISGNKASHATGTASSLSQNQLVTSGQSYPVTYTVTRSAGSVTPYLGGTAGTTRSAAGTFTDTIVCGAGADPKLAFTCNSTFVGSITGVQVGDGHPPAVTIDVNTPFPEYNRTGGDAYLAQYDGPWWNPDFEMSNTWMGGFTGIVNIHLGNDNKPVFSGQAWASGGVHSSASFNAWWNDFPSPHGPNDATPYQGLYTIPLTEILPSTNPKTYQYDNPVQFPIDGMYMGNYVYNNTGSTSGARGTSATCPDDVPANSKPHNFAYTYELHILFTYKIGQVFTFIGDDDVYVFINKLLAIDLGGVHGAETGTVTLGANTKATDGVTPLGLVDGQVYQFDFFYCERHTTQSHMKITTSIPLNSSTIPDTF